MKGYIVLVSKQIFPAIQGIAWAQQNGFDKVVLLYTPNSGRESEEPALRIKTLCESLIEKTIWRAFEVECRATGIDKGYTPQEVTEVVEAIIDDPTEDWVLNTTGGLKLMSFGSANLVGKLEIHYKELVGGWFRLVPGEGCGIESVAWNLEDGAPHRNITDVIPIAEIVRTQYSGEEGFAISPGDSNALTPLVENLLPFLREKVSTGKEWRDLLHEKGIAQKQSFKAGDPLEYFIYAILRKMGIQTVDTSLRVTQTTLDLEKTPPKEIVKEILEVDVIANFNGQLVAFEAKLSDEEGMKLPTLLQKLAPWKELTGIGGRTILVAPHLVPETKDANKSVSKAYQITIWDGSTKRSLVENLYELFFGRSSFQSLSPDDELRQIDAFFRERFTDLFSEFVPMTKSIEAQTSGFNWSIFKLGRIPFLLWRSTEDPFALMGYFENEGIGLSYQGTTCRKSNGDEYVTVDPKHQETAHVFHITRNDSGLVAWLVNYRKVREENFLRLDALAEPDTGVGLSVIEVRGTPTVTIPRKETKGSEEEWASLLAECAPSLSFRATSALYYLSEPGDAALLRRTAATLTRRPVTLRALRAALLERTT